MSLQLPPRRKHNVPVGASSVLVPPSVQINAPTSPRRSFTRIGRSPSGPSSMTLPVAPQGFQTSLSEGTPLRRPPIALNGMVSPPRALSNGMVSPPRALSPIPMKSSTTADMLSYRNGGLLPSPLTSHVPSPLLSAVRAPSPVQSPLPGPSPPPSLRNSSALRAPSPLRHPVQLQEFSLAATARQFLGEEMVQPIQREPTVANYQSRERMRSTAVRVQPIQEGRTKEQIVTDAFTQAMQEARQRSSVNRERSLSPNVVRQFSPSQDTVVRLATFVPQPSPVPSSVNMPQTPLASPCAGLQVVPVPIQSPILATTRPQPGRLASTGFLDNPFIPMPPLTKQQPPTAVPLSGTVPLSGIAPFIPSRLANNAQGYPPFQSSTSTFLHPNGDSQLFPRQTSEYLTPSEYSFFNVGMESDAQYGKSLSPLAEEGGEKHILNIKASDKDWGTIVFSSEGDPGVIATNWLQMHGRDPAFKKGLVSQMRHMVSSKLMTASVDVLDLL